MLPDHASLHRWLDMAQKRIKFQGLPARICWLGLKVCVHVCMCVRVCICVRLCMCVNMWICVQAQPRGVAKAARTH
jgi:hypothetical protein